MAKYDELRITLPELFKGYNDDGDGGVYAYDNKLIVRPAYQREFVYTDKKRNAVMETVIKGLPLNTMWWAINDDGTYELLDGQQRTISICQYMSNEYSINGMTYGNLLQGATKDTIDNYELTIYIFKGTEEEKLAWFRTINIANEVLTNQELLNATYTGTWLADAKRYFSKRDCVAKKIADGFVKGNPIRQDYLETALTWIADRDNLSDVKDYMSIHQHDKDANELWVYYQNVINWAKTLFNVRAKITDCQEWGKLYNKYKDNIYNSNDLENQVKELLLDDDVTKKSGVIPYLLSNRKDEKALSIRAFTESQKISAYEKQNHQCPHCLKKGIETKYAFEEMQGDHIIAWSKGGHTVMDNLQMLCSECNNNKSNH